MPPGFGSAIQYFCAMAARFQPQQGSFPVVGGGGVNFKRPIHPCIFATSSPYLPVTSMVLTISRNQRIPGDKMDWPLQPVAGQILLSHGNFCGPIAVPTAGSGGGARPPPTPTSNRADADDYLILSPGRRIAGRTTFTITVKWYYLPHNCRVCNSMPHRCHYICFATQVQAIDLLHN